MGRLYPKSEKPPLAKRTSPSDSIATRAYSIKIKAKTPIGHSRHLLSLVAFPALIPGLACPAFRLPSTCSFTASSESHSSFFEKLSRFYIISRFLNFIIIYNNISSFTLTNFLPQLFLSVRSRSFFSVIQFHWSPFSRANPSLFSFAPGKIMEIKKRVIDGTFIESGIRVDY